MTDAAQGPAAAGGEAGCAHLHLHSAYSLTDGLLRIEQLAAECPKRNITAVALTDYGNLFAFISFYKAMRKVGIKPLCGVEIPLRTAEGSYADLVLLARNRQGYKNLIRLVSRAYKDSSFDGQCRLERDWLPGNVAGLSALSCGQRGEVGSSLLAANRAQATQQAMRLAEAFDGEFFLEVMRQNREGESEYLAEVVELSARTGIPLTASNDVRFLNQADFEAHEARVCVARKETLADTRRRRDYTEQQYLRSAAQMAELFADLPEALENANTLARRCNLNFEFGQMHLPSSRPAEGQSESEWMRRLAAEGLQDRLQGKLPANYARRLEAEIEIIERTNYVGYFLVVAEFVTWAKENEVRVGPGRGSGAGSLVAWALGITDIDPIQYGLLFERFLNPERVSPPDFDIDFEPQGRNRVIDHVVERYGREAVAQIATLDVAQAKGAVRDAARVLGRPHSLASRICDYVPFDSSLTEAIQQVPALQEMADRGEEREILDLAQKLEGLPRNASRHAGGVVIAPGALEDYVPLFRARGEEWVATQYDKKDLETVGLVKFDFLGLTTLKVIDDALEQVNRYRLARGEPAVDRSGMPLDDPAPYQLLAAGRTAAIFQLESPRMLSLIQKFAPSKFDELIALLALIRPGPLEAKMFDQAVRCKSGQAKIKPPHKLLAEVVGDTWGVMVYQEQVMEAARRLADYSYGEADELRRAMGAKDRREMARHRSVFVDKASAKGIAPKQAESVFDLMEHFAGYGFNKSHSAAYALISFQTAWLKAHYPAQMMSAALTQEAQGAADSRRRWILLRELKRMGIRVLPPDINASHWGFVAEVVDEEVCVRFGICALSGIGEAPCVAMVQAREQGGNFTSLHDLARRAGLHRWDIRTMQVLNDAGAFESLGVGRLQADAQMENARLYSRQRSEETAQGQSGLFGGADRDEEGPEAEAAEAVPAGGSEDFCPSAEQSRREKQAMGVYLMHHPLACRRRELEQLGCSPLAEAVKSRGSVTLAGLVYDLRSYEQRGRALRILTLEDETGSCEVRLPDDISEAELSLLQPDAAVLVESWKEPEEGAAQRSGSLIRAQSVDTLARVRASDVRRLVVAVSQPGLCRLPPPGAPVWRQTGCEVVFRCSFPDVAGEAVAGEQCRIAPTDETLSAFQSLFGNENVWFEYNN